MGTPDENDSFADDTKNVINKNKLPSRNTSLNTLFPRRFSRTQSPHEKLILNNLKQMSQPLRSSSLRRIAANSPLSKTFTTTSIQQSTESKSKSSTDIVNWVASIRKKTRAALIQDDTFEMETEEEISRTYDDTAELFNEYDDDEEYEDPDSFVQLGNLLNQRKRNSKFPIPDSKKQKVSIMNQIKLHFVY